MRHAKTWVVGVVAAVATALLIVGISGASIPDTNGVIHGCYKTGTATLHPLSVEDSALHPTCPAGYAPLLFDQAGVRALFGDGSDGNKTLSGTTTLTRDMYYNNLTLAPSAVLAPNGYRVFVRGTLSFGSGSQIAANGGAGTSGTGGNGITPGTLGGSATGGAPISGGGAETNSLGGSGGIGAVSGGAATPPAATDGGPNPLRSAGAAIGGRTLSGIPITGGGGGGGGSNGGGGVVVIVSAGAPPAGVTLSAAGGSGAGSGTAGSPGTMMWLT